MYSHFLTEHADKFISALHDKKQKLINIRWEHEPSFCNWFCGHPVNLIDSNTHAIILEQIDNETLLKHFDLVLSSQYKWIIATFWQGSRAKIVELMQTFSEEKSYFFLKKVIDSDKNGKSAFMNDYIKFVAHSGVIGQVLDEINDLEDKIYHTCVLEKRYLELNTTTLDTSAPKRKAEPESEELEGPLLKKIKVEEPELPTRESLQLAKVVELETSTMKPYHLSTSVHKLSMFCLANNNYLQFDPNRVPLIMKVGSDTNNGEFSITLFPQSLEYGF